LIAFERYAPEYKIVHGDVKHSQKHVGSDEELCLERAGLPYEVMMDTEHIEEISN
jgi:hypothetical protein